MQQTIRNLTTLLQCKSVRELGLIMGVHPATIFRAKQGKPSKHFKHTCQILEMVLKELPPDKLNNCRGILQLMFLE